MKISFFVPKGSIFSCNYNSPSIQFNVNNCTLNWLIDTGASISAIEYKYIDVYKIPFHKEKTLIRGIGGSTEAIGYVCLNLRAKDNTFSHKFFVFHSLPCRASGIIGDDFLNKYCAILNYDNHTLSLLNSNNQRICLPTLRYTNEGFLFIPSRSESIHFISTTLKGDGVVCSKEICEGVFMANSIVSSRDGKIPIKILNTTERDLTLNNIEPVIHSVRDYECCMFESSDKSSERVKKLFSMLQLEHLNDEEKSSIERLCAKFPDIFYLPGDKLTTTNLYEQTITLKPNTEPVYIKPYRLPYAQHSEVKKQIEKMLSEGIIEPTRSEWSSPVLLVPKKSDINNGKKWRLVVDYRKLNNVIEHDKFPLPNITEVIDSLSGSIYFSQLDLSSAYYQVSLHPDSRKFTAFCSGQYQMARMPMGLKTSPSAFSRMINIAMSGLNYEKCLVYLDNLVTFGKSISDHNKNLLDVFIRLRECNLKLNPEKCDFLRKEMLYLGHVVSENGVSPDPEKVTILTNYPQPTNTDEARRFVAFANYYRKFIKNFAKIAYPLNALSRKNVPFIWDDNCKKAFDLLKKSLTTSPVLQYPDFSKNNLFTVQTDASGYAIGAVLSNKNGNPIAFASRSLNKAEKLYPTIEKELLAIVWAVKHFRPYLYGRTFKILTDHKPLIYLFNMKDPSSRLMKFRLILEEYDFSVEYIKGTDNVVADTLSRLVLTSDELKEMHERVVRVMTRGQKKRMAADPPADTSFSDDWPDQPRVVETSVLPKESVEMSFITNNELNKLRLTEKIERENKTFIYSPRKKIIFINPASRSQLTPGAFVRELGEFCKSINVEEVYFLKNNNNNIFVKKMINEINGNDKWSGPRLIILKNIQRIDNKDDQRVVLNDFHLLPTSGHAGIRRMFNNIKHYYYWPGLENDIKEFVHKCEQCQKQKYSVKTREPMTITTTAGSAFEKVFLDIVGPLPKDDENYSYILTLQCELTKYVEAYPLITKSSTEIAQSLVCNFILRYGIPLEVATDRGAEFTSDIFKQVCKLLNIKQIQSTAYHHESIGALENTHKNLGAFLRIQTDNHPEGWSRWLPFWNFSYNTSVHSQTRFTPYELVFGKKCILPSNLTSCTVDPLYNCDHYPAELRYRIQVSLNEARDNLLQSKHNRKIKYDSKINSVTYKPNDLILLKNETGNKLDSIYLGPYVVIRDLAPNVEIMKNGKLDTVHKNRTKLFIHN